MPSKSTYVAVSLFPLDGSAGSSPIARLRGASLACGSLTIALASGAVIGWVAHNRLLQRSLLTRVPMQVDSAACFLLVGVSLLAYSRSEPRSRLRRAATAFAALGVLVSLAMLAERALGVGLGLGQPIGQGGPGGERWSAALPPANFNVGLVLLALGLLLWDVRLRGWWATNLLAWLAAAAGLLALYADAAGVGPLVQITSSHQVGLDCDAALTVLMAAGALLARPDRGEIALLASDRPAGMMLRRLLPAAIALPCCFGALLVADEHLGVLSSAVSMWLLVSAVTFTFVAVGWAIAVAGDRADAQRGRLAGLLRALAETASDAIVTVGRAGAITYANPALARMFGLDPASLVGRHVEQLFAAGDRERLVKLLAHGEQGTDDRIDEGTGLRSDGHEFAIEISRGAWTVAGEPVAAGIIRDVSARRRTERKLRQLLDSAPDAIVVVESAGEIVLVSARAESMFGYTREELTGKPVEVLIPQHMQRAHRRTRDRWSVSPQPRYTLHSAETCARRKDGTVFPVEITLNPVQTDDGP